MPTLFQRTRAALRAFRGSRKDAPYLFPVFQGGQAMWHMDNFKSYTAEGYDLNTVIYTAVSYKGRTLGMGRLRAYQGDISNPSLVDPKHPLARLLARPNPYQSWQEFQWQRAAYLNLSGNSYTYLDRPKIDALPTALWNMRPDRVFVVPNDRTLMGYMYVPDDRAKEDGTPILPQDMIHIKFPNPMDRFEGLGYGLSPMAPLSQSGDVDNAVTRYLKVYFERGSMPPGVLKSKQSMTDTQVANARRRWQEIYGGVDNWTDIAVLDNDLDYSRVGFTFAEMGFKEIDERNETRMLGPFGVPPILIGIRVGLNRATFANASEARKACWQDTLYPEQLLFHSDDDYYLSIPDEEIFTSYDNSQVPALQQDQVALIGAWSQMVDRGVPIDQAFQIVGMKVDAVPGGSIAYRASAMTPVASETEDDQTNEGAQNAVDETREMSRELPPMERLIGLPVADATPRLPEPLKKKDGRLKTAQGSTKPPTRP